MLCCAYISINALFFFLNNENLFKNKIEKKNKIKKKLKNKLQRVLFLQNPCFSLHFSVFKNNFNY